MTSLNPCNNPLICSTVIFIWQLRKRSLERFNNLFTTTNVFLNPKSTSWYPYIQSYRTELYTKSLSWSGLPHSQAFTTILSLLQIQFNWSPGTDVTSDLPLPLLYQSYSYWVSKEAYLGLQLAKHSTERSLFISQITGKLKVEQTQDLFIGSIMQPGIQTCSLSTFRSYPLQHVGFYPPVCCPVIMRVMLPFQLHLKQGRKKRKYHCLHSFPFISSQKSILFPLMAHWECVLGPSLATRDARKASLAFL